jgi:YfiH family protein
MDFENIAFQHQIHSDIIKIAAYGGSVGESDAIITPRKGMGVAISTADCTTIYLYDVHEKIIAGVHSGWRGTEKRILAKTIDVMRKEFDTKSENIFAYIAPAISQKNYEVGEEVVRLFNKKYSKEKTDKKFLLDVSRINYDILIELGIPKNNIENSNLCSFAEEYLHSYRRDGDLSGRAIGILAFN